MSPLELAYLSLEGLSVGDAFGQCFFRPDAQSHLIERVIPDAPWLFTDDTEMSLSIVSVLARFGSIQQDALAESLASHYDFDRAYGPSMHRLLERIRHGEDWRQAASSSFGGQGSWGNGAAMRAAPVGAYFSHDLDVVVKQAALSAEVTHTHPEGIIGAVAVAVAAAQSVQSTRTGRKPTHQEFLGAVIDRLPPSEVRSKLVRAKSINDLKSIDFAISILGNGVEMSAQDTVPIALWCSSQFLDSYTDALWLAASVGGDRDTICAITGGIVAGYVGYQGIPEEWKARRESLALHRYEGFLDAVNQ